MGFLRLLGRLFVGFLIFVGILVLLLILLVGVTTLYRTEPVSYTWHGDSYSHTYILWFDHSLPRICSMHHGPNKTACKNYCPFAAASVTDEYNKTTLVIAPSQNVFLVTFIWPNPLRLGKLAEIKIYW